MAGNLALASYHDLKGKMIMQVNMKKGNGKNSITSKPVSYTHLVHAGKVIAATAIDLIEDTSLLDEARAEFEKRTKDGFVCPIPADAVPVIPD